MYVYIYIYVCTYVFPYVHVQAAFLFLAESADFTAQLSRSAAPVISTSTLVTALKGFLEKKSEDGVV